MESKQASKQTFEKTQRMHTYGGTHLLVGQHIGRAMIVKQKDLV